MVDRGVHSDHNRYRAATRRQPDDQTPPRRWGRRATSMGTNTVTATDANFETIVASETPVLVDFWAEWCGPCKMMNTPLEEIAGENAGKLSVAKLNVDENGQTAMNFDVMSIPTMIVFQSGVPKKRLVGARSKAQLMAELSEFIV
jgi:thioredoxin 1